MSSSRRSDRLRQDLPLPTSSARQPWCACSTEREGSRRRAHSNRGFPSKVSPHATVHRHAGFVLSGPGKPASAAEVPATRAWLEKQSLSVASLNKPQISPFPAPAPRQVNLLHPGSRASGAPSIASDLCKQMTFRSAELDYLKGSREGLSHNLEAASSLWCTGAGSCISYTAMYSGICLCLLLAALSVSSSGQQTSESHNGNPVVTNLEQSLTDNHRNVRSPASGRSIQRVDGNVDQKANLEALLAKYLQQARRGSPGKVSVMGLQNFDPTHRIKDRDYVGWMDFGRRSAEEYEYSS